VHSTLCVASIDDLSHLSATSYPVR
jgi:hypothetical protein